MFGQRINIDFLCFSKLSEIEAELYIGYKPYSLINHGDQSDSITKARASIWLQLVVMKQVLDL